MADLFVSYSRRDKDFVRKLVDTLLEKGRDVWIDWDDIPPSADWWKEIERGIQSADSFVFVISPDSVRSRVVRQEIETAVASNKRLIPIVWVDVTEQADLDQMHPEISAHNWIFFNQGTFEDALGLLNTTLDTDLDYVKQHTRILVRAREWESRGRDNDYVLRGDDLEAAQDWLTQGATKKPEPLPLHSQYIVASQRANAARQRVVRSGISFGLGVAIILALIAAIGFRNAAIQRDRAEEERDRAIIAEEAERQRANEVLALSLADNADDAASFDDFDKAIALALEAILINALPEAEQSLARAAYNAGVRQELVGSEAGINSIDISLDGKRAISGNEDGDVAVWNIETNEILFQSEGLDGHGRADVLAVALNLDGTWAVSADEDGLVIAWDAVTGAELYRWEAHPAGEGFTAGVNEISISPSDGSVFTVGNEGLLRQWTQQGSLVQEFPQLHTAPILSLSLTIDGTRAITGDELGRLVLWDISRGVDVTTLENAHSQPINAIDISFDGGLFVTAAGITGERQDDPTAKIWTLVDDTISFEKALTIATGDSIAMFSAAFSPDGLTVVTGAADSSVYVWDVRSGRSFRLDISSIESITAITVSDVAIYSNSLRALASTTGLPDRRLVLIDIENGTLIDRMTAETVLENGQLTQLLGHSARVQSVAYSPDARFAVSGGEDFKVLLWNLETGRVERQLDAGQHTDDITAVAFSPSGRFAASASEDDTAILWDVNSGTLLHTFQHDSDVKTIAFSPDGSLLVTGTRSGNIILWDPALGTETRSIQGHTRDVLSLAFNSNGDQIVTGSRDATIRIWDTATGAELHQFGGGSGSIFSVAFSPDGQFVMGGALRTLSLWNIETGEIVETFAGHRSTINSVAFLPDGEFAISASSDQTLILWNIETGGVEFTFEGHRQSVTDLDINAEGTRFISGSSDQTVNVWRIDSLNDLIAWTCSNRAIAELTEEDLAAFRLESAQFSCNTIG